MNLGSLLPAKPGFKSTRRLGTKENFPDEWRVRVPTPAGSSEVVRKGFGV